eukprot:1139704-Rhodomonas_salina.1
MRVERDVLVAEREEARARGGGGGGGGGGGVGGGGGGVGSDELNRELESLQSKLRNVGWELSQERARVGELEEELKRLKSGDDGMALGVLGNNDDEDPYSGSDRYSDVVGGEGTDHHHQGEDVGVQETDGDEAAVQETEEARVSVEGAVGGEGDGGA